MSAILFSEPWAQAWAQQLNTSDAFRSSAAEWDGTLCFKMRDRNAGSAKSIFLELRGGECAAARVASEQDLRSAEFVLSARERVWTKLVEGRSEPLVLLMTGLIRFERGRLADFTGHGRAAQELMKAAQRIG